MKKKLSVIGLMSGTSADGIDVALTEISGSDHIVLKGFKTVPFSSKLRQLILKAGSRDFSVDDVCRLNFLLGEEFAKAVISLCLEIKFPLNKIDLIGSHGQTIKHLPEFGSTLQIGEPSIIAERIGATVVADFRPRDMAAGGQGAPLASYLHYHLFHSLDYPVAIQNIGGVGNLTFINKGAKVEDVIAFDTGPGNMLMDTVVSKLAHQPYDLGGQIALRGKIHKRLLRSLLYNPYFKKKPPKTTGREMFGSLLVKKILENRIKKEDIIATVTAFTAKTIALAYEQFILPKFDLKEIIVGGGGAKNKTLLSMIQKLLPSVQIKRCEDFGFNSQAIEAMAFALLAYETIHGKSSNIPKATGASHPVVLGKIIPGKKF